MSKQKVSFIEQALKKNNWSPFDIDGLTLLRSPLLNKVEGITHAFTTRLGGKSQIPLDSFNLGRHWTTDESRQDAMRNREQLCQVLNLDFNLLAVPGQQHTTNIHWLDQEAEFEKGPFHFPALDALATNKPEQPLLLHFADCVPVIIVDKIKKTVCVVHAGWRGTAGGIVAKAVQVLIDKSGSRPCDLAAAIGPAISSCCFQAGEDVAEALLGTVKEQSASDSLIARKNTKPHPDLKAFNALQLLELGLEDVDVSDLCTACNPQMFYSHRQSGGQTGRQGAIASIIR